MLKIKMIDVELDFPYDLADPDDAEKWEDALDKYVKDLVQIEGQKNTRQSQIIRDEIAYEKAWLDEMFGEGTGEKVFQGRENYRTSNMVTYTLRAVNQTYLPGILTDAIKEMLEEYSPKRAQRKQ